MYGIKSDKKAILEKYYNTDIIINLIKLRVVTVIVN